MADKRARQMDLEARTASAAPGHPDDVVLTPGTRPTPRTRSAAGPGTTSRTPSAGSTTAARTADTGLLLRRPSGLACRGALTAGTVHHVEGEWPQVVAGLTFIDTDRCFGALARHPHDPAADKAARLAGLRLRLCLRLWLRPASRAKACAAAAGARTPTLLSPLGIADWNDSELSVLRHRVFVFLPEILPLNQDVDAGWKRVAVLRPIQGNRASVLFAPKYQFGFLFTAREVPVGGHRHRHHHRHHGNAHEQRGHRVATLARTGSLTL